MLLTHQSGDQIVDYEFDHGLLPTKGSEAVDINDISSKDVHGESLET